MKVHCIFCAIVILLLFYDEGYGGAAQDEFRQEGAKVLYMNPKYVKDVNFFTLRHDRNSPYLTSGNVTTLDTFTNNATVVLSCYNARTKQELFTLDFKACEVITVPWAKDWIKQYSNIPLQCPVPPDTYVIKEIELPPRNFPIPLPAGDYSVIVSFMITKTKEKILDLKANLRFAAKKFGK